MALAENAEGGVSPVDLYGLTWADSALAFGVELRGLEPLTPTLPVWCATSCATAPFDPFRTDC